MSKPSKAALDAALRFVNASYMVGASTRYYPEASPAVQELARVIDAAADEKYKDLLRASAEVDGWALEVRFDADNAIDQRIKTDLRALRSALRQIQGD